VRSCLTAISLGLVLLGIARVACAAPGLSEQPASGDPLPAYAISAHDPARARALEPRLRDWFTTHAPGAVSLELPQASDELEPSVPVEALEALVRVEQALAEARALSARFAERAALARLADAHAILRGALEIPRVHVWLAEVDLQLGLCAAQLGELGLAETALTRAASLDPQRKLQSAEAPPSLVTLARAIERRRESAADSHVRVEVDLGADSSSAASPGVQAELWLDGQRLGRAPLELSAPSGAHLLRVSAAGFHSYATVLELGPGRRLPLSIRLVPTAEEEARRNLLRSLADPAAARSKGQEWARASGRPLLLVQAGDGPLERARVMRCAPVCTLAGTLGVGPPLPSAQATNPAAVEAWLRADSAPSVVPRERVWWRRWPVWAAGAAVVVGAGLAAGFAARPEPQVRRERELTLDPGSLPK
jgi:hypothetical protein